MFPKGTTEYEYKQLYRDLDTNLDTLFITVSVQGVFICPPFELCYIVLTADAE